MPTGTVRLHRVLRATPERIYRAFLEPDAMAKWLPPYGFTCTVHHMDARVGGTYRMSFTNFGTGNGHSFGGEYHELVPNETIRYTDSFEDPNLPGTMETTVTLAAGVLRHRARPSSRRGCRRRSRSRCATSAGRSPSPSSPSSSSRRFRTRDRRHRSGSPRRDSASAELRPGDRCRLNIRCSIDTGRTGW